MKLPNEYKLNGFPAEDLHDKKIIVKCIDSLC
jgi:hypothetical protein